MYIDYINQPNAPRKMSSAALTRVTVATLYTVPSPRLDAPNSNVWEVLEIYKSFYYKMLGHCIKMAQDRSKCLTLYLVFHNCGANITKLVVKFTFLY